MINHSTNQLGKVFKLGGKEHNLSKMQRLHLFQSTSEADYANNLDQAAGSYNLIYGVGLPLHNAVEEAAKTTQT